MPNGRWDRDRRGKGVASAANATIDLERLVREMSADDWVAEEPEKHLLPHLREYVERHASLWRLVSAQSSKDGRYLVQLQWVDGAPSRGKVRAEAFALIGSISEASTHVRERSANGAVEYEVATGLLEGDAGWLGHGHVVVLHIEVP